MDYIIISIQIATIWIMFCVMIKRVGIVKWSLEVLTLFLIKTLYEWIHCNSFLWTKKKLQKRMPEQNTTNTEIIRLLLQTINTLLSLKCLNFYLKFLSNGDGTHVICTGKWAMRKTDVTRMPRVPVILMKSSVLFIKLSTIIWTHFNDSRFWVIWTERPSWL